MPRYEKNDKAPFRIIDYVTSVKPEKVQLPDLKVQREKQSFGGCMKNFAIIFAISGGITLMAMGVGTGQWDLAIYTGIGIGAVLGGCFAPLLPIFKRIISGRG